MIACLRTYIFYVIYLQLILAMYIYMLALLTSVMDSLNLLLTSSLYRQANDNLVMFDQ